MSSCWTVIFGYFWRKRSSEALITGCCTAPWVVSSRSVPSCAAPVAGLAAAGAVVAAAAGLVASAAGLVASAGFGASVGFAAAAAAAAGVFVGAAAAGLVGSA